MTKVDLTEKIGFKAELILETGEIKFGPKIECQHLTRTLGEVVSTRVVFQSEKIPKESLNKIICRIYRLINDERVLNLQKLPKKTLEGIKYDITVIMPYTTIAKNWTGEFPKTTGHYHLPLSHRSIASPDFYQIIYGKGEIILQERHQNSIKVFKVLPQELEPVLIGPQYGHTTVNIGKTPLLFCNLCVRAPHLDYESIRKFNGAPYYLCRNSNGGIKTVKNESYAKKGFKAEKLIEMKLPPELLQKYLISKNVPLFNYIGKLNLEFLLNPQSHLELFHTALQPKY